MFEATLCQIYTLCSLAPLPAAGEDGSSEMLVRALIFWGAYTKEGITSGLRGGRLILFVPSNHILQPFLDVDLPSLNSDEEDLRAFQRTLPPDTHSSSETSHLSHKFAYVRRHAELVLDISSACRMVHTALTGPRARQRCVINSL
jgi:hypothetical protein